MDPVGDLNVDDIVGYVVMDDDVLGRDPLAKVVEDRGVVEFFKKLEGPSLLLLDMRRTDPGRVLEQLSKQ